MAVSEKDRAADLWNRIGLAFAKYPRTMDAEERAAREEFMAFCIEQCTEVARLRRIEAAALKLANHLPSQGAATPHTPLVLGEYGATLLYTLRETLEGVDDGA